MMKNREGKRNKDSPNSCGKNSAKKAFKKGNNLPCVGKRAFSFSLLKNLLNFLYSMMETCFYSLEEAPCPAGRGDLLAPPSKSIICVPFPVPAIWHTDERNTAWATVGRGEMNGAAAKSGMFL